MDRAEGALLVAEKAIEEIAKLRVVIEDLQKQVAANARTVPSFAIDDDGDLVVAAADGHLKKIGRVKGRDGSPAREITGAALKEGVLWLERSDQTSIEVGVVKGDAGADGRAGLDGLGFDDFDLIEEAGEFRLCFIRGETRKEFSLPVPVDAGVWRERTYRKGQGVTWAGSFWIAQKDTDAKPDSPDSGWRLAVKRGRDGREVVSTKPEKKTVSTHAAS